jgi:1-acyl-sn-glycerol-3-phosphate acyltransferase
VLALLVAVALSPLLVLAGLAVDVARRARALGATRLVVLVLGVLVIETVGLCALLHVALTTRPGTRARVDRALAVQRRYTEAHLANVRRALSVRFVVEGDDVVSPGPLLVFCRHASIVDVLIPGAFVASAHRIALRYVLKRELLAEPCLDVAGHWLPNAFVDRSGADSRGAIAAIRALAADLGRDEGVLIYPEGTRFTARKRRALLDGLEGEARARVARLRHLLPIRRGGSLALLDTPGCDVLVVGHHGLEGFARLGELWRGHLVGRTVTVRFWREPAAAIPEGDDARAAWLDDRWVRLDAWLEERSR